MLSGAEREILALAERAQIPIAVTLLGIGGVPASHPLNLGMMGMHGEAWVNKAIQEADLLIALGMRFDDRVTGNLKTYAPAAQDSRRHRSARAQQERQGRRGDCRRPRATIAELAAAGSRAGDRARLARAHRRAQGRHRGARHPEPARRRPSVCRARHQRPLARNPRASGRRDRRRAAPDVGGAALPTRTPRSLITSGGSAPWDSRFPPRSAPSWHDRGPRVGDRRRRRVPDDRGAELATVARSRYRKVRIAIVNNGYLGMVRQWQEFFYGGATRPRRLEPRFRQAGRGVRHRGRAGWSTRRRR